MIRSGCRRLLGAERGSSTIEAMLIVPVFFFGSLFVVQLAMGWLATNVAEAAARQGLHAATVYLGSDDAGREQAQGYLDAVAPHLLAAAQVEVTRTGATVTVRVQGPVPAILPWPHARADASASGPVERFAAGTT